MLVMIEGRVAIFIVGITFELNNLLMIVVCVFLLRTILAETKIHPVLNKNAYVELRNKNSDKKVPPS